MPTLIICSPNTAHPNLVFGSLKKKSSRHSYEFYRNDSKPDPEDRTNVSVRRKCRPAGEHKQLLCEKMW